MNASTESATPTSTASDPSMTRLAPQSSRRRNLMFIVAGALVLVGAAVSPLVLRPSVVEKERGSTGSWSALPTNHQIVTTTSLTTSNWPGVDVRSVEDVRGASVEQAWLISKATFATMDLSLDESVFDSGVDYLRATMPTFDLDDDALPRRLERDGSAYLVVLWNVENCDALDVVPPETALVELGSIIRTSRRHTLPEIATPGFFPDTLRTSGTCA